MAAPDFGRLSSCLLRSGVAPRHVQRTVLELTAHFEDLVDEALAFGCGQEEAQQRARRQLGDIDTLVHAVRERKELLSWAASYPHVALLFYPLACLAVLPAVPVIAGAAYATRLARWIACAVLSGLVTAGILLVLQLSITLT
jgi:hypothetical protein